YLPLAIPGPRTQNGPPFAGSKQPPGFSGFARAGALSKTIRSTSFGPFKWTADAKNHEAGTWSGVIPLDLRQLTGPRLSESLRTCKALSGISSALFICIA